MSICLEIIHSITENQKYLEIVILNNEFFVDTYGVTDFIIVLVSSVTCSVGLLFEIFESSL